MRTIYKYIVALAFISSLTACGYDYESFVDSTEYLNSPSNIKDVGYEALPGQILLKWSLPSDSNYFLLKINYFDHLTGKDITVIRSAVADSLLVSDTRAKFGDYTFSFQTFNSKNEGGEITRLTAQSGKAPIQETITRTKIKLTAEQLSSNAQEPSEGPISNLLDGDPNTFFHTAWSVNIPLPHYMDIRLDKPITDFEFYFQNRAWGQSCAEELELYISNDNKDWELLTVIDGGLPTSGGGEYRSSIIKATKPFTYLRWLPSKITNNNTYWNMAEFAIWNVDIQTYDPESN